MQYILALAITTQLPPHSILASEYTLNYLHISILNMKAYNNDVVWLCLFTFIKVQYTFKNIPKNKFIYVNMVDI